MSRSQDARSNINLFQWRLPSRILQAVPTDIIQFLNEGLRWTEHFKRLEAVTTYSYTKLLMKLLAFIVACKENIFIFSGNLWILLTELHTIYDAVKIRLLWPYSTSLAEYLTFMLDTNYTMIWPLFQKKTEIKLRQMLIFLQYQIEQFKKLISK